MMIQFDKKEIENLCFSFGEVEYSLYVKSSKFGISNKLYVVYKSYVSAYLCNEYIKSLVSKQAQVQQDPERKVLISRWYDKLKDISEIKKAIDSSQVMMNNISYSSYFHKKDMVNTMNNHNFDLFSFYLSSEGLDELKNLIKLNKNQYMTKFSMSLHRKNSQIHNDGIENKSNVNLNTNQQINLQPSNDLIISSLKCNFICDFHFADLVDLFLKDKSNQVMFNFKERLLGLKNYNIHSILDAVNHQVCKINDGSNENNLSNQVKIEIFNERVLRIKTQSKEKYKHAVILCSDLVDGVLNEFKIFLIEKGVNPNDLIIVSKEEYIVNINN